jgi:hypothetical protein
MDSIFRDSIRKTFIPPMTIKYDTIKVFTGKMDTLSADTVCYFTLEFNQDAATYATIGHFRQRGVRTTYNRETKEVTPVSEKIREYDCNWFFSEVSSDAKFVLTLKSLTPGVEGDKLSISKYAVDNEANKAEFLLNGLTFTRDVNP